MIEIADELTVNELTPETPANFNDCFGALKDFLIPAFEKGYLFVNLDKEAVTLTQAQIHDLIVRFKLLTQPAPPFAATGSATPAPPPD